MNAKKTESYLMGRFEEYLNEHKERLPEDLFKKLDALVHEADEEAINLNATLIIAEEVVRSQKNRIEELEEIIDEDDL